MNAQTVKKMIFDAAIIVIIGVIIKKIVKLLTPAHKSIGSKGAHIITAVPKSGWLRTINAGIKAIKSGIIFDPKFFICKLWSAKSFASVITITHLAISDGCRQNGKPKFNHRYVPATFCQHKGSKTAINIIP